MKTIPLSQGKVALVDDADFEKVNQFEWYAAYNPAGRWYAQGGVRSANGKWTIQMMHRVIMGLEHGDPRQVDHKNREMTLDNRRKNLRVATVKQNRQNAGLSKNNTSTFKGVSWHKATEKWEARISTGCKRIHLGNFETPKIAAQAYDAAVLKYHGVFAVTNEMLTAQSALTQAA
jgi:hypothetical protein